MKRTPVKRTGAQLESARLAQQYRPVDRGMLGREARRLLMSGLKPQDVAHALRMPMPEVLELQGMLQADRALQSEVRRLATEQHLSAMDIATALRLDLAQVRTMLAANPQEAAAIHREHADAARDQRHGQ